jgi:hypothetical protein
MHQCTQLIYMRNVEKVSSFLTNLSSLNKLPQNFLKKIDSGIIGKAVMGNHNYISTNRYMLSYFLGYQWFACFAVLPFLSTVIIILGKTY